MCINKLVRELGIGVKKSRLVINQGRSVLPDAITQMIDKGGLVPAAIMPRGDTIGEYNPDRKPILTLGRDNPAVGVSFDSVDHTIDD